jgi:AAA domain
MGGVSLNGSRGRVRSRLACDVTAEPVVWLWPDRVPMAATTLLEGQPKVGKSTIAVDLAARVSTGRAMPDDDDQAATYDPMGVVILSAEDHPGRVIRPRLEAAGADLSRIRIVDGVDDLDDDGKPYLRPVSLPEDLPRIESIVCELPAGLVIVDPLMAFLSSRVKSAVDQDVRRALFPLRELAERTGAAVLIIRHFRKSRDGEAINWGGGSIGIAGAARSVLQVGQDPNHDDRCVLVHTASNFGAESASLAYRIVGMATKRIDTSKIEWQGESTVRPEDLGSSRGPGRPADLRNEVEDWLLAELESGPDMRRNIMDKAKAMDYAERTVLRAKTDLGVTHRREGMETVWELP